MSSKSTKKTRSMKQVRPAPVRQPVKSTGPSTRSPARRKTPAGAVREQEDHLRLFIEHVPAAMAMFDRAMRYLAVSRRWLTDYGIAGDVIGRSHDEVFPDIPERWKAVHRRGLAGESLQTFEHRCVREDGTEQWVRWAVQPWRRNNGSVGGLVIVAEDITVGKQVEEALRESETLFRSFFENCAVGVAQINSAGRFIRINDHFCQITGYSRDELIGRMGPLDLDYPDEVEADRKRIADFFQQGTPYLHREKRYVHKDGHPVWVRVTVAPVHDAQGIVHMTTAIIEDITARKQIEDELRDRSDELQITLDTAAVGLVRNSRELRYRWVNKAYAELVGRRVPDIIGCLLIDVLGAEAFARLRPYIDRVLQGERVEFESEVSITGIGVRWLHGVYMPDRDAAGDVVGWVGSLTDVTALKLTEAKLRCLHEGLEQRISERTAALQESQQRLEVILQGTRVATWDWEIPTGKVVFNEQWALIRGLRPEDVVPHVSSWIEGVHPEDWLRVETTLRDYFEGKITSYECEMRIKMANGEWAWIMDRGQVIERDAEGKPRRMAGIELNITARKQAEEALRDSEEQFRTLVSNIPGAVYQCLPDERRSMVFISDTIEEILGYPATDFIGNQAHSYSDLIHPEDRRQVEETILVGLRERRPYGLEYRVIHASGAVRWVASRGQGVYAPDGTVRYLHGVIFDVTDRKQGEEELRVAFERLQLLRLQLSEAEEMERKRLARELHDEFGQVLTGLKFDVVWLQQQLVAGKSKVNREVLVPKAAAISESIEGLMLSVRAMATALRPGMLDDLGPLVAIEWLTSWFRNRTGLGCEVKVDPVLHTQEFGPELSTALFRCVQELLTNVMRHAGASHVSVSLTSEPNRLRLTVNDNGRGITQEEWEQPNKLGLRGVHERVALLGGHVEIEGSVDQGTTVRIAFPQPSSLDPARMGNVQPDG